MTKEDYSHIYSKNADDICSKIREEAEYEIKDIIERARKEADRIISEARKEADKKKGVILEELGRDLEKMRDKIEASLNLEKKRIVLQEKSKFAEDVMTAVKKEGELFRSSRDYAAFLKKSALEGAGVVDDEKINVFYSFLDEKMFNDSFMNDIGTFCRDKLHRDISFTFQKMDFKDIGVIVQSIDGRRGYDNRFLVRLKRSYDDIYMRLLKEAF